MKSNIALSALAATFIVSGCAIGPDYVKPNVSAPEKFRAPQTLSSNVQKSEVELKWWKNYQDEGLETAIEEALAANFDLRAANSQVEALLGQFDEAKSYLYPHINGGGSMQRQSVKNSTSSNLKNGLNNTFSANLTLASYEIDLFGKVRRATEAARAMLLSGEQNKRVVTLSVASAVAASYAKLSSLNAQIEAAGESLKAAEEIEKITAKKYKLGAVSETEWLVSVASLEGAKASLSSLKAAKMGEEATFNILCGKNPTTPKVSSIDKITTPEVKAGIPSDILSQRPDIGAAEQNLIAANARIGVARGAYFPSISLTGLFGAQSAELSKLFSSPTRIWQFTPSVTAPIFTAGLIEGQIREAEAAKAGALATYEKTVVTAFNEADNAIGQKYLAKEQANANAKRAEAMEKAFKSAKLKYELGAISYMDMLTVQQNWLSAKSQAITAKQNELIASINLYKALGGGYGDKELPQMPSLLPAGR